MSEKVGLIVILAVIGCFWQEALDFSSEIPTRRLLCTIDFKHLEFIASCSIFVGAICSHSYVATSVCKPSSTKCLVDRGRLDLHKCAPSIRV